MNVTTRIFVSTSFSFLVILLEHLIPLTVLLCSEYLCPCKIYIEALTPYVTVLGGGAVGMKLNSGEVMRMVCS